MIYSLLLPSSADHDVTKEDAAADAARRASVEAATTAFHEALRMNDADALFAYVAEDVLMMPPGEPVIRGEGALREWYAGFLSQYHTTLLTLSDRELFVGDGWAVELGTYEWDLAPVAGGEAVRDRGSYMQLWKAQSGGVWRFHREIWNSSAPASPTAEPGTPSPSPH